MHWPRRLFPEGNASLPFVRWVSSSPDRLLQGRRSMVAASPVAEAVTGDGCLDLTSSETREIGDGADHDASALGVTPDP
jgi:hypothetical protein